MVLNMTMIDGFWDGRFYAVVVSADVIAFIHSPGDRTDDELRALVNAPPDSGVKRSPGPGAGPDPDVLTWPCMVCGEWRPDALISVAHRYIVHFPESTFTVRYCNDRPECVAFATADGPWAGRPERAPERP
jgi:hypothetical protein